ncbi:MAG: PhoX family protein, partial [bacterium]
MDLSKLSHDEFDELRNPGPEQSEFEKICEKAFSRRDVFKGGMKFGLAALALSSGAATLMPKKAKASRLAFDAVQANGLDTITVPRGYTWHTVVSWGDPMWSGVDEFDHATRGTGASQELAFGDNNDGMTLFQHDGHYLLALNNEYTNLGIIHGNRDSGKPENPDDVRKNMAAQGNTVVELANRGGRWGIVKDSPFNRRITPNTPMEITGPAAGHELMKTSADPSGTRCLGTWNNCAN